MSHIENALTASRHHSEARISQGGQRADFLQALRALGTVISTHAVDTDSSSDTGDDIKSVFLQCSRETWDWVFGPPRYVANHCAGPPYRPFQTWECACSDGSVLCLGQLCAARDGTSQVVLYRICTSPFRTQFTRRRQAMLTMTRLEDELTSADLERVKRDLLVRLRAVEPNQEHVLAYWDLLDEISRAKLATEIDEVDFELLAVEEAPARRQVAPNDALQTPPVVTLDDQAASCEALLEGEHCLSEGRVGVVLVAGGMGSRLGFEHPKGMLPVGAVSEHSLLQIFFERIVALKRRYGVSIPLYLMTSDSTHDETREFLNEHDWFGLDPDDVRLFRQGTLPTIDAKTRRLLLDGPGKLTSCPDGHGGLLDAARKNGCFDDMARRGLDVLFYGQMDNPLLLIGDAELIGQHLLAHADITTQVVRRASANEKVGMFVARGAKNWVLEYSELPKEVATATDDDGSPLFWAGNTGVHLFRVSFLKRIASRPNALPVHPCRKKVEHLGTNGQRLIPDDPNAIKFERFIFDLMHHTNHSVLVECDRALAFAPIKNPQSMLTDTLATARAAMVKLHSRWLREAGTEITPGVEVEISPLFALGPADLQKRPLPEAICEPTFFG